VLLNLYELQKSLVAARSAMTAASNQRDVSSGLLPLQAQIASELNTAGVLSRAVEGYSGLPTADQRRQLDLRGCLEDNCGNEPRAAERRAYTLTAGGPAGETGVTG
jgi:hypothetical protein